MSWSPDEYVYDYSASNYDANDGIFIEDATEDASDTTYASSDAYVVRPQRQLQQQRQPQPQRAPQTLFRPQNTNSPQLSRASQQMPYNDNFLPKYSQRPYGGGWGPSITSIYPQRQYESGGCDSCGCSSNNRCGGGHDTFVGGGCMGGCAGGCATGCKKKEVNCDDSGYKYFAPETLQLVKIFIMIIVVILLATSLTVAYHLYKEVHRSIKTALALLQNISTMTK
jgi:hypothetical protein